MSVNASVDEVMKKVRQQIVLQIGIKGDQEKAAKVLEQIEEVERIEPNPEFLSVTLAKGFEDYTDLPSTLIEAGHKLTLFREEEINLESAFMALTKGMGKQTDS